MGLLAVTVEQFLYHNGRRLLRMRREPRELLSHILLGRQPLLLVCDRDSRSEMRSRLRDGVITFLLWLAVIGLVFAAIGFKIPLG